MTDHFFSSLAVFLILTLTLMAGIQPVLAEESSGNISYALGSGNISGSEADLIPANSEETTANPAAETEIISRNTDYREDLSYPDDSYENSQNEAEIKTWYVNAGAPAGGDGSKERPYQQIQTALDACNTSDDNTILIAYAGGAQYSNFTVTVPDVKISSESDNPNEYPLISNPNGTGAEILADNVTLSMLNISGCYNPTDSLETMGGAISVYGCKSTDIYRCIISENNAIGGAGVSFVDGSGAVRESELFNNTAEMGGSLLSANSSVMIYKSKIHNSEAAAGGGGYFSDSECYIGGSEFSENTGYIGGGFMSSESELEISNSSFSENYGIFGGGLLTLAGDSLIYKSSFDENYAVRGGGILSQFSATELEDSELINNSAYEGGGFSGRDSADSITNCDISGNYAISGAGIDIRDGDASITRTKILYNSILTDNSEVSQAAFQIRENTGITDGAVISDCVSDLIPAEYFNFKTDDLNLPDDISLSYGAGILVEDSDNFIISYSEIAFNGPGVNQTSYLLGSGVALVRSTGALSGSTISENYADLGAGIFCQNSSTEIFGNTVENNNATVAGAGICLLSGNANIGGNTISQNNATIAGGGIQIIGGEHLIYKNTIPENNAGYGGAGVCQIAGISNIAFNTIRSNTAGDASSEISGGGGILLIGHNILGDSLIAEEITDEENLPAGIDLIESLFLTAGIPEGISVPDAGISVDEDKLTADLLVYEGYFTGEMSDSVKEEILSGAVSTDDSIENTLIFNNVIVENSAGISGGGVRVLASDARIYANSIINNTATAGGGVGIMLSSTGMFLNDIYGNKAAIGGGMSSVASVSEVLLTDFMNNTGLLFGGGISSIAGETVLEFCYVSDNIAGLGGGGLNSASDRLVVYNSEFTGNSALGSGNYSGGGAINIIEIKNITDVLPETWDKLVFPAEISEIKQSENSIQFIQSQADADERLFAEEATVLNPEFIILLINSDITENRAVKSGGGVNVIDSEQTLILECNISKNTAIKSGGGVSLISTSNTLLTSSFITDNIAPAGSGIYIQDTENLMNYDNILINRENIRAESTYPAPFDWNVQFNVTDIKTFTVTTSPYGGGNVWGSPDKKGISQTCTDADLDGICDSDKCIIYDTDKTLVGTDERPLYYNPEYGTIIALSSPEGADVLVNGNSYGRISPSGYYMLAEESTVEMFLENYFNSPTYNAEINPTSPVYVRHVFTDIPEFRSTGSGSSPLDFVANGTKTSADVKSWEWHIASPDGVISSYDGDSVRTVFAETGIYNVTLDAIWNNGNTTTSLTKTILVTAPPPNPKASEKASVKINGTVTETLPDGSQRLIINETLAGNVTTTPGSIIIERPDGTRININTTGSPTVSGGNVTGQISSVTMQQPDLNAAFNGSPGNASVGVSMTMNSYNEDASLTTEISEGCADDAKNAFSVACPGLNEVAYTVYFTKSGFDTDSSVTGAVLDFSVNTTWVNSMGGPDKITIVRWKDDGTSEQIKPQYLGISGMQSLFRAVTDGFSVYGVAGFTPAEAPSDSSSDDNPVCVKDLHNLKAGSLSVTELTGTAFTEISITPAKDISDLRITTQEMNYPGAGMGVPKDAEILEYIKTTLYYTAASSLERVSYTAKIPVEWLDNNNSSLPAVWYYNESAGLWNKAEILSTKAEDGYIFAVSEPEMPGFGWFAVGGIPVELILGNETLPLGPGPEIPSEEPAESVTPASPTATAEPAGDMKGGTPVPTTTPLSVLMVVSGIFAAAGVLQYRKKH
ncbi:hypothetical protein [Methanoplanus endosymbiosus]|uniref:PKD domain-containing protein n=1 Tax=Methanoplanus endosymbiosus TaxID=33865 RepID=A0A9E7TJ44_9EURY|nr:hypothetical protein [Methanoplanus endosymbiosus]UUX93238.1 hypothetical protein L6E24_03695 [Methanoplanus endosymbiosus]